MSPVRPRNTIRLYMSMSLDGFIAGPDDRTGQELGQGDGRLFDSLSPGHIELELVRRLEARDVTLLRYRVRHSAPAAH